MTAVPLSVHLSVQAKKRDLYAQHHKETMSQLLVFKHTHYMLARNGHNLVHLNVRYRPQDEGSERPSVERML